METKFLKSIDSKANNFVVVVSEDKSLPESFKKNYKKLSSLLEKFMKHKAFKAKKGESVLFNGAVDDEMVSALIISYGAESEVTETKLQKLGGKILASLHAAHIEKALCFASGIKKAKYSIEQVSANIATGALLRAFKFDKYFTKKTEEEKFAVAKLDFVVEKETEAKNTYTDLRKMVDAVYFTRQIVTEPPNVIHPESLAQICEDLSKFGLEVEVLGEKEMKKLGMGALLGVGQGSRRESKLVVMKWNGAGKKDQPIAFVGKGVCFDTGGISLKPSNGMEDMKYDMAGSAVVIGLLRLLADRKAKVNAIGVVGLVENMPDGNAQRPSDVVVSMSKQTIEVLNTDAEGRLVLADALWYTQKNFKPKFMIDLATLTGAIVVALGSIYSGVFSNNDELVEKLIKTGQKVEEKAWRFPMGEEYDKQINSEIADVQNQGNERGAGSITAAHFLQRFVNDVPWVHIDIAGVAWQRKDSDLAPKGATAYGVRLLNQLVKDHFEK